MAYEFYVTIEGTKQGKFKGESPRASHSEKLAGIDFSYEVKTMLDAASGKSKGKRQHGPVTFTKEWGAATPQLFQALVSNEVLKSALFEFVRTNDGGEEEVFHTVRLTNAIVSQIQQYATTDLGDAAGQPDRRELEDVSLTFRSIEIENIPGKTVATDTW